jgi:hypothetical protein
MNEIAYFVTAATLGYIAVWAGVILIDWLMS